MPILTSRTCERCGLAVSGIALLTHDRESDCIHALRARLASSEAVVRTVCHVVFTRWEGQSRWSVSHEDHKRLVVALAVYDGHECQHEDVGDDDLCKGCGLRMPVCPGCSDAGGAFMDVRHTEPICESGAPRHAAD